MAKNNKYIHYYGISQPATDNNKPYLSEIFNENRPHAPAEHGGGDVVGHPDTLRNNFLQMESKRKELREYLGKTQWSEEEIIKIRGEKTR